MKAPAFWQTGGPLATLLTPAGWLYAAAGRIRRSIAAPYRAPIPVICVGNLTAGGTGKTPTVIDLLGRLQARGIDAHAVTRGYGGSERGPLRVDIDRHSAAQVGDEPLLLAATAPVWVARSRAAGVRAAAEAGAGAVILDDGHQNPTVEKDLSLVLVDGGTGFGNGRMVPAGPLREPVGQGLARADAALIIGDGPEPWPGGSFDKPVLRARLKPRFSGMDMQGTRVLAFAGIGRPEKFFDTVRSLGAIVVDSEAFPDHHRYEIRMIERLLARAEEQDLALVTTEKDMVKLPKFAIGKIWPVPVDLRFEDEAGIESLLDRLLEKKS